MGLHSEHLYPLKPRLCLARTTSPVLTNAGGTLYFSAEDDAGGRELLEVRRHRRRRGFAVCRPGARSRPRRVRPVCVAVGARRCFSRQSDATHGRETVEDRRNCCGDDPTLSDINPGACEDSLSGGPMTRVGALVLFVVNRPRDRRTELSEERAAPRPGRRRSAVDLMRGAGSGFNGCGPLRPGGRQVLGNLFVNAEATTACAALRPYVTDGTAAGTVLLRDDQPRAGPLCPSARSPSPGRRR